MKAAATLLVAIDPGKSGGIAWWDGETVQTANMPETPVELWELILDLSTSYCGPKFCWLEKVGNHVPGNSIHSSSKLMRNFAHLEMALIAAGIPHEPKTPQWWRKRFIQPFSLPRAPGETRDQARNRIAKVRKENDLRTKEKAQRIFTHIRVTNKKFSALGMLHVLMEQKGVTA